MKISEAIKDLGRPVVFYPKLAAVFGIPESIFISHFVYWSDKGSSPDGWIYKSAEDITAETGISYEQQRRIRKALCGETVGVKGRRLRRTFQEAIIEERHDYSTHRLYFRVNFEALDRCFSQTLFSNVKEERLDNVHGVVGQSPSTGWTMSILSTESTTESTQRDIPPSAVNRDFFSKGASYHKLLELFSQKAPAEIVKREFEKFVLYWTEPNKSGSKVRWEQQSTFEIRRRLATWINNVRSYKSNGKAVV